MKRVLHRKDAPFWFAAVRVVGLRKSAGEFERAFPGFSAAVAEEGAVKPGDFSQQALEFRLILVEEQIRNMNHPAGLPFDRRLNGGVNVAGRNDSNSTWESTLT